MLRRTKRLDRSRFQIVRRSSLVVTNNGLSMRFSRSSAGGRFSVVIPSVAAPLAVSRNTLRRRIYEILHSIHPLPTLEGVIYLRKETPTSYIKLQPLVVGLVTEAMKRLKLD